MPNWTHNTVTFEGRGQTLQRLAKALKSKSSVFTFNNIIPCPPALLNDEWQHNKEVAALNVVKYGYEGWYDWRVAKWGTKWEAVDARWHNKEGGGIIYTFDTAWSPPTDVVDEIARRYPSLTITHEFHEEAGMYPSCRRTYKEGSDPIEEEIENYLLVNDDEDTE